MPALNVFLTDPSEKTVSLLQKHAAAIGCITLPYGACTDGLDGFQKAVLLPDHELPQDLLQKHPDAAAVFSYRSLPCELPLIQCCSPGESDGPFVCFCLSPPEKQIFVPPGLTDAWVTAVRNGLKGRSPDTVTVELCAGAYAVPFPYDGHYSVCSVSDALRIARTQGSVLNVNKYSYYSYFIYSDHDRPHVMFLSSASGVSRMVQAFSMLGITRFALSAAELSDPEMSSLFSFFRK